MHVHEYMYVCVVLNIMYTYIICGAQSIIYVQTKTPQRDFYS